MPSAVATYLAALPDERRAALKKVRATVNANLPDGFVETIQFGMISWVVPFAILPDTYNKQPLPLVSLASQKSYMALYLMAVYGEPKLAALFAKAYKASGKRLDMGKSCVRFKTLADLPLDVIGETIGKVSLEKFVAAYRAVKG